MDLRRAIEVLLFFFGWLALTFQLVKGHHGHPGFISIDCGIEEGSDYTDEATEITYDSDSEFIDSGVNVNISADYRSDSLPRHLSSVRSFPQGNNNCYTFKPTVAAKGNKYLIRAIFMYGNYDSKNQLPEFGLYLEVDVWDTVKFENASEIVTKEIIHVPKTDYIQICLVNYNTGTPFVSALEIRELNNSIYETHSGSLKLVWRLDVGSTDNKIVRNEDDEYDRIWEPFSYFDWEPFSAAYTSDTLSNNIYQPPLEVMRTAVRPANGTTSLDYYHKPDDPSKQFYWYLHFAEVEKVSQNQLRKFKISFNGDVWREPIVPNYLFPTTVNSTHSLSSESSDRLEFSIYKTNDSTLPPILNALELYMVKQFLQLPTDQNNVDVVRDIKFVYGVERNWQGDPCAPRSYSWDGLVCRYAYDGHDSPVIISLNLSSSSLTGNIAHSLSNLTSLESLDLSNNSLTGSVPAFLGELSSLKTLNLSGNKLTGSVPSALIERSNNGDLSLRVDGNPNLCVSNSCRKKNNFITPVVASIALCLVLATVLALFWWLKRRKNHGLEIFGKSNAKDEILERKNRQFTYAEVVNITGNFQNILGKGGFGTVYGGNLEDGTQVAVKMLSLSSTQGAKQFRAEVQLLTKVHHRNLASLIGYCNEGQHMGLIYEYMSNGNLRQYLSEKSAYVLSWVQRLQIAVDAAQALEYLHNGCKPPIIHRDIKTSNILLNEKLQAKVADFGLSRVMPSESETPAFSTVVGTPGYLDPEYYVSNMLNEKSDVYSFGIVLLELITGKPAVMKSQGNITVMQWIKPMLQRGEIMNIVDSRLQGNFDTNSVWKALEIAMACIPPTSIERPNMSQVLVELKECLETEIAHRRTSKLEEDEDSFSNVAAVDLGSSMVPNAR